MLKRLLFVVLAAVSVFSSCSDEDTAPVVHDNPVITLPMEGVEEFSYGESREYTVSVANEVATEIAAPAGWMVDLSEDKLIVTAPRAEEMVKENAGEVTIKAKGYNDVDATASFEVKAFHLLTFEDVADEYLAGPTAYGDNLYNGGYVGYLDPVTDLFFHTTIDGYKFASGGIAISRWNDKLTAGYLNQCSVYYGMHNGGDGGFGNSKTFALIYNSTFGDSGAYMYFQSEGVEHVIDHAYVTNNTYAVLSMENGDAFAKAFSYEDKDWFKLTITGVNAAGEKTGEVEVYLADFRMPDAGGILTEWKKVDLTPLGKVNRINFSMSSSDGEGMWMNTPSYFCLDNIAVEL